MTLQTSLVIGGDAAGAIAAAHASEAALEGVASAAGKAAAASDRLAGSNKNAGAQSAAGFQNLNRQIQDIQVQLQGGTGIGDIISQQGGQVADALSQMGGKFGAFGSFLTGPFGTMIIAATGFLAGMVAEMISGGDEADKLGDKSLTLHDALFQVGTGSDEARKALAEYNAEQERGRKTTEAMIKVNLDLAESKLKTAIATRESLAALLAEEEMHLDRARRLDPTSNVSDIGASLVRDKINANEKLIGDLREGAINLRIEDAARDAKAAADPIRAINNKYDEMAAKATRAAEGNDALSLSLKGLLSGYEKMRQAELDAQRASSRKPRERADPYAGRDLADFGAPVIGGRVTSDYGTRTRPTAGASTNHLGVDYGVGVGTAVYATQDGVILHAARRGGYGNQIGISHGGGTETRYSHLSGFAVQDGQSVSKGQLIGYSGGKPGAEGAGITKGPHLHYEVLVNGKKVDPSKGRFPFDASGVAAEADKAAEALAKFGDQSSEKIQRINAAWDEQPKLIDQAGASTRELDATIKQLTERKPEGWHELVAQAERAKQTVQDGLLRPFKEMAEDSAQRLTTERLITAGKEDEAEALQRIWTLESKLGPLAQEQKNAVLEQVRHEKAVTEELQRRQELISSYLDTTRSIKQELVSIFSGSGSVANLFKIGNQLSAQMLVEKLFGKSFREFDEWVKGQSGLASSVEFFSGSTKTAGQAALDMAQAMQRAMGIVNNPGGAPAGSLEAEFDAAFGTSSEQKGAVSAFIGALGTFTSLFNTNGELMVKGSRDTALGLSPSEYFGKLSSSMAGTMVDALNKSFDTQFFSKFQGVIEGGIKGYLTAGPAGGILGALQSIPGLPKGIAGALGTALGGAQTGTTVSGIAGAFGIRLNSTGSQIGGAIGSLIPIPGGDIIGSIAGGIIGNLLGTRPRGGASVSNSAVGAHANTGEITASLNDTGSNIQSTIVQIASALGASVGAYSIGIGRYKDYYQVSSNPNDPRLGNSYFGRDSRSSLYDGLDPAAAMKAALAGAISQGAIQGISEAMQKALASSKDVQAAIQEALKVHEVELAIGGIGASLADEFKKFERQASERLRIARQYGFDIAKIEEKNAEDRAKLVKDLLAQQIGSLQQLIDDMTSGSLFEGSAVDQRQILLDKIAAAKIEADKGTAGAADELARLLSQLNAVSRDVYGTTGGFAADRSTILDASRDTIAQANQRIAEAQAASDPALTQTNAALDENNAQNAQIIAGLDAANAQLALLVGSGSVQLGGLAGLARTSGGDLR